jgi:hypothetical protein
MGMPILGYILIRLAPELQAEGIVRLIKAF